MPLYGFTMVHRRPTTPSILSPEGNFRHSKSAVRAIFGCTTGLGQAKIRVFDEAPLERREATTTTTVLWISQQQMLQSRIGQRDLIR